MTSKAAQKTFWELTTFPRYKHGVCDDGTKRTEMWHAECKCRMCGEQLWDTVSLEFCNTCGFIETDYWHSLDA